VSRASCPRSSFSVYYFLFITYNFTTKLQNCKLKMKMQKSKITHWNKKMNASALNLFAFYFIFLIFYF
jgi:hypothetical protein